MRTCDHGTVEIVSDRRYRFPVGVEAVWEALGSVDRYRTWWPWLRRFDAGGLRAGDRWHCTIAPPVPYELRFVVELTEVSPLERIVAVVSGDVVGAAEVGFSASGVGCHVSLQATMAANDGPLRAVVAVSPWLARFGHDWILDTGARQFQHRALVAPVD